MKKRLVKFVIIVIAATALTNSAVSAQDEPAGKQSQKRIDPVSGDVRSGRLPSGTNCISRVLRPRTRRG